MGSMGITFNLIDLCHVPFFQHRLGPMDVFDGVDAESAEFVVGALGDDGSDSIPVFEDAELFEGVDPV